MALVPLSELVVGLYLGLLTGIFPGFIAFTLGFGFKYLTDVTVPGFGVVVLGGALAGISGGMLALVDPQLAGGWTGISAILVVLMICLWAHSQGDRLAAAMPRRGGFKLLKRGWSAEGLAGLVDAYGQVRLRPLGEIQDMEGYPPLPNERRQEIRSGSWRFPANLSPSELEARLEERLVHDHDLADASVRLDRKARVEIAAAPISAGLSRRVPEGQRAVSVRTLLPTGMTKGDVALLRLPDGEVTGDAVSARSDAAVPEAPAEPVPETEAEPGEPADEDEEEPSPPPKPAIPRTSGGTGRVTVAVTPDEAKRVLRVDTAPMHVEARGKQREFQVLEILKDAGNRFRKVHLPEGHPLVGESLGTARIRERFEVGVLAIRRPGQRIVAPTGATVLAGRDTLTVVGQPDALDRFEAEVAS